MHEILKYYEFAVSVDGAALLDDRSFASPSTDRATIDRWRSLKLNTCRLQRRCELQRKSTAQRWQPTIYRSDNTSRSTDLAAGVSPRTPLAHCG